MPRGCRHLELSHGAHGRRLVVSRPNLGPAQTPNPLRRWEPPCPTGKPTPARSHERPTQLPSTPLERVPDLPRVVVARIEGQGTLYEVDLTAAPSREWRAAFLRPPPALITADRTPEVGRVAIHGTTVRFRTAP